MDIKQRLIDALQAIAAAKPAIDYETAFKFLMQYVPGSNGESDQELQSVFSRADAAIRRGRSN